MKTTESELKHIFHPVEHAIISNWLGKEPPLFAQDIDIHSHESDLPEGVIQIEPDADGGSNEFEVDNAIARIVLSTIQHKLPQWVAINGDKVIFGRLPFEKHESSISFLPQFLFEINWATSGPGYSWPVAYHVGYLPHYDIYVVTESADSPDANGYTDRSVGYFTPSEDIPNGSERVITADWKRQFDEYDQQHWEELWRTGVLSDDRINKMADSVWEQSKQEEALS